MPNDIAQYKIPDSDEVYYIPNFITEDEEEHLIRKIKETPQPKWKKLSNRRLQIWGGDMSAKNILISQPMPPFLSSHPDIIGKIRKTGVFQDAPHGQPNHVILNEYLPGQGIMPHEDGPAYYPTVATVSLGSHTVLHYYCYQSEDSAKTISPNPVLSLVLERRSLIVTKSSFYTSHLHGIDAVTEDQGGPRGVRYSLTCRDVKAVKSMLRVTKS